MIPHSWLCPDNPYQSVSAMTGKNFPIPEKGKRSIYTLYSNKLVLLSFKVIQACGERNVSVNYFHTFYHWHTQVLVDFFENSIQSAITHLALSIYKIKWYPSECLHGKRLFLTVDFSRKNFIFPDKSLSSFLPFCFSCSSLSQPFPPPQETFVELRLWQVCFSPHSI